MSLPRDRCWTVRILAALFILSSAQIASAGGGTGPPTYAPAKKALPKPPCP